MADELLKEQIHAQRMDAQAIASLTVQRSLTPSILKAVGIDIAGAERDPASPREVAAYAYAFFGAEPNEFRSRVIERTLLTLLAHAVEPVPRKELVESLLLTLQLSRGQAGQVASAIDRLLQQQAITADGKGLTCTLAERAKLSAAFSLRVADLKTLKAAIAEYARKKQVRSVEKRAALADAVVEHLGSVLMAQGDMESGVLAGGVARSDLQAHVRDRLHSLHAVLDSAGWPEATRGSDIKDLTRIAMESSFGKLLLAGEVFLSLSRLKTSRFIEAAANAQEFVIALDASVAIPVLCAQLHGAADQRFFLAAQHLHEQARLHGVPMLVPEPYLEECASHLMAAFRDYMAVIDQDADLRASQNAYVAHFKLLFPQGTKQQFRRYLGGFGLTGGIEMDRAGRNRLMVEIGRIFRRYKIEILSARPPLSLRKEAEIALTHAMNDLSRHASAPIRRDPVLLRHDATVIASLNKAALDSPSASVLCSWDRLHFHVHEKGAASFDVMDPAALGDMLSLALDSDAETSLLGPTVLAMQMQDEEVERGAAVWDALTELESGNLSDAELLQQAKEFKADFLAAHAKRVDRKTILAEWAKWKDEPSEKS